MASVMLEMHSLRHPDERWVDLHALLRIDGQWRDMNKTAVHADLADWAGSSRREKLEGLPVELVHFRADVLEWC